MVNEEDRTQILRAKMHELQQILDDWMRRTVDEFGLTLAQAGTLLNLGAPLTTKELSDRLVCEPSNATFVADKLEKAGYLVRQPHPTDRRMRYLTLTPKGIKLRRDLLERVHRNDPLPGLSDTDLADLEARLDHAIIASAKSKAE
jgi:DNA-binding MarR family transcriptional regulator